MYTPAHADINSLPVSLSHTQKRPQTSGNACSPPPPTHTMYVTLTLTHRGWRGLHTLAFMVATHVQQQQQLNYIEPNAVCSSSAVE